LRIAVTNPQPESPVSDALPAGNRPASAVPLRWTRRDTPISGALPDYGWTAILLALVFAASVLDDGFYDFSVWGALSLAAITLLVFLAWVARPALSGAGRVAIAGLVLLLALSFASMAWAESKDSAWTDANRLALYVVAFTIVVMAVRERRTARAIMLILGSAALLTSLWLCGSILLGGGADAFLTRRLNAPIGYINGTAGLLLMGIWPWVACAESARRRLTRAGALGAATLVASTMVLAESRAVVPAIIVSTIAVLLCAPQRTRRAVNLILVALATAATLPWTLPVYSSGGLADRNLAPSEHLLLGAAIAMILAALGVAVVAATISLAAARVSAERKSRAIAVLGWLLILSTLLSVAFGVPRAAPWISTEYSAFTSLHVNEDVAVRFTDASGYRYDLWRVALVEFRNHPLAGLGAGNYDTEYYALRQNPEYIVQPHSIELQMAAELGIGGVVALLLFVGGILVGAAARAGTLASTDRLVKVSATGMFVAWLAHTSVDWLYDIPGLTVMALISAALLVIPARRRNAGVARTRRGMALLSASLVVLAALAATEARQYLAAREQSSGAAQVASSPQLAITTLEKARSLDPYSLTTLYSLASAYARLDDYADARRTLLAAETREPHNYVPPALLGDIAVRRGDLAMARAAYARALALNPRDPMLAQAASSVSETTTP
jgi:hypothetical protein